MAQVENLKNSSIETGQPVQQPDILKAPEAKKDNTAVIQELRRQAEAAGVKMEDVLKDTSVVSDSVLESALEQAKLEATEPKAVLNRFLALLHGEGDKDQKPIDINDPDTVNNAMEFVLKSAQEYSKKNQN